MKDTPFDLTGKAALVTGGSRGLGKAMARLFAQAGADVMICSRKEEELRGAAAEIADGLTTRAEFTAADLTDRNDVRRLADEAVERLGKIDILVNNAGQNVPQPIDQIDDATWDRLVQLNLTTPMQLTRALVPAMKQRGWGRVIHISSIMALQSTPERNAYSATKAALHGTMMASALDLGPHGVTVNCIAPGPFATEMPMAILSDEQKQTLAARTAVGRWGEPDELAPTALLLASDAGRYITGTVVVVDGGATCRMF
jgi:NAD(P)-dependent dehydrogenase (short-subunit alcohol dehydrogenase family)